MEDNTKQPTELENWTGWLQARIPALKESHNVFWLKQAMEAYKTDSSKMEQPEQSTESESESVPSAIDWYKERYGGIDYGKCKLMQEFASLCVEQAREEWYKEKEMCQCGNERIGSTKLWCCNQCGKRHEIF